MTSPVSEKPKADERIAVLVDTDIGSDIDDALALSYLLRQPRCELVGVTTVSGDVAKRAACARALCEAAGRAEVPIHHGASEVLLFGPGQPEVPHYPAIADRMGATDAPRDAVEFLRQTIRARPGEITLLSIGPFTNIALLFALDPEIPTLLRSFVSMAGSFGDEHGGRAEWNVKVDPAAAAITYRRAARGHLSVGLNVTLPCVLPVDVIRHRLRQPPLDVVADMAEIWFRTADQICFHDPLAATLIFRPDICGYEDGFVDVDAVEGSATCAVTRLTADRNGGGRHRAAMSVDPEAFFDEFFAVTDPSPEGINPG